MNSLSWLIYLASVCDELRGVSVLITILGAIATIVLAIHWKWRIDFDGREEEESAKKLFTGSFKMSAIAFAVAAFIVVLVPSKDTIYAIAASEIGEEVIKSPEASKARQALNAWLDKQIGEPKQVEK